MPATCFQAHFAGGQIKFVVKDDNVIGGEFEIAHRLAHGLARKVHKGLGLEQRDLFRPKAPFAGLALKLGPPAAEPVVGGDPIHRHKPDVMTVLRVFRAGISKANKQFHRPNLQYAAVQR